MILLGLLLMVAAMGALLVSMGLVAVPDKAIRSRLLEGGDSAENKGERRRIRQLDRPEEAARFVVTQSMVSGIEHRLVLAGHPAGWSFRNIVLAKILVPVALLVFVTPFAFVDTSLLKFGVGVAVLVVGYFVPDLLLQSRAQERQEQMQRELPDLLDKMVISIEAGLGFEAALGKTAEAAEGPLADEFVRTVQDIRLGMSRRAAYEALQARTANEDVHQFIRGIMQAEEHGSSISSMVRIQSKEMRMKRKLRAEAKAGQVSVKLLGPLMVCIFPVLFIVILTPGIMRAIETFR